MATMGRGMAFSVTAGYSAPWPRISTRGSLARRCYRFSSSDHGSWPHVTPFARDFPLRLQATSAAAFLPSQPFLSLDDVRFLYEEGFLVTKRYGADADADDAEVNLSLSDAPHDGLWHPLSLCSCPSKRLNSIVSEILGEDLESTSELELVAQVRDLPPGFLCLPGSRLPTAGWENSWGPAAGGGDGLTSSNFSLSVGGIVSMVTPVAATGSSHSHDFSLLVYPRSHWLISDLLSGHAGQLTAEHAVEETDDKKAHKTDEAQSKGLVEGQASGLPRPWHVPAASPTRVRLNGQGRSSELLLLHPWTMVVMEPNTSETEICIQALHWRPQCLGNRSRRGGQAAASEGSLQECSSSADFPDSGSGTLSPVSIVAGPDCSDVKISSAFPGMWAGWRGSVFTTLTENPHLSLSFLGSEATEELHRETEKAQDGNWAVPVHQKLRGYGGGEDGARAEAGYEPAAGGGGGGEEGGRTLRWHHVSPSDLFAFTLLHQLIAAVERRDWQPALPLVRQLASMRPLSSWTFYMAGLVSMKCAPAGQLGGRAGRKCVLEDAERFLSRALDLSPSFLPAYAVMAKALLLMGRGREAEVESVVQRMLDVPTAKETMLQEKQLQQLLWCEDADEEKLQPEPLLLLQHPDDVEESAKAVMATLFCLQQVEAGIEDGGQPARLLKAASRLKIPQG